MQRILIADDSTAAKQQVLDSLESLQNVELATVDNGIDAIRALREQSFQMLICDFEMPKMNGLQVVRAVRSWASPLTLPILLLTSRSSAHDKATVLQAGANDYVTKPVEPAELVARVTAHLRVVELRMELEQTQAKALESHKLQAIGRLAGGMAHEINTPVQYMSNNLDFIREGCQTLLSLVQGSQQELSPKMKRRLSFLEIELPKALAENDGGLRRIADIVAAVKQFSEVGDSPRRACDINLYLGEIARAAQAESVPPVELHLKLDENLPELMCAPESLTQALRHLIRNAVRAARDRGNPPGEVEVRSSTDGHYILIAIQDTGIGIPDDHKSHIFDPFFTTRDVGDGLGQGLTLARTTVVNEHGGELNFESQTGVGSTFFVRLPLLKLA